jgi:hypothetical protein
MNFVAKIYNLSAYFLNPKEAFEIFVKKSLNVIKKFGSDSV